MKVHNELHPRTRELRTLMKRNDLTARQVATLVGRSRQSVKRWMQELTLISESMLSLLKYRLQDQSKKS